MIANILCSIFVGFVVILAGFGIYFHEAAEIKEQDYAELQQFIFTVPEMKVLVSDKFQDGKISNYEYVFLKGEYESLLFERQKNRLKHQTLDSEANF